MLGGRQGVGSGHEPQGRCFKLRREEPRFQAAPGPQEDPILTPATVLSLCGPRSYGVERRNRFQVKLLSRWCQGRARVG